MTARRKWSARQVRSLGVVTDLATLGSILGTSETSVREAYHAGRLPAPVVVLRVGRKLVVPTAPVLRLLGIDNGGDDDRSHAPDLDGGQPGTRSGQPANGAGGASPEAPPAITITAPSPKEHDYGQRTARRSG